jgi:Ca2+-binding RTX toxin-like protein
MATVNLTNVDTFLLGRAIIVTGMRSSDTFNAGFGDDVLFGLDGDDVINGFDGDDVLNGGSGTDILNGGAGDDELDGGAGTDTLQGEEGDDRLFGGGDDDGIFVADPEFPIRIRGGLFGGAGDDFLDGGSGNDILNGGPNNDVLKGGAGNDTFIFNIDEGFDTIEDFTLPFFAEDRIRLDGITEEEIRAIAGTDNIINDADPGVVALADGGDRFGGEIVIDFQDVTGSPSNFGILTVEGVSALNLSVIGPDIFLI